MVARIRGTLIPYPAMRAREERALMGKALLGLVALAPAASKVSRGLTVLLLVFIGGIGGIVGVAYVIGRLWPAVPPSIEALREAPPTIRVRPAVMPERPRANRRSGHRRPQ